LRFTLGLTGLYDRFAGRIYSVEDVSRAKPAPDLFLHAAAGMNTRSERCVVIEDSPAGIAAAKAASMRALGYAAGTPIERLSLDPREGVGAAVSGGRGAVLPLFWGSGDHRRA
jgi:beta-phosphoglucomutase-like phosphatase (HAD superfamily)